MATWSIKKLRARAGTRLGILTKTLEVDLLQTCFVVENFGSNRTSIAIRMHGDSLYSKYGGILLWTDF